MVRPHIDDFNLYYGGKALARASGARTRVRRQGTMLTSHPSEESGRGRSPLEIRLLGPIELLVDGEPRAVRAAGERALLARLAISPGQIVSRDRLIDELWEEALPANPPNALHLRVAKLRRLVGAALVAEPPGYRLDVGEAQVDASRFAQLVTARRFDEALALWRGPPYGDLADRGWARAEAGRLVELRASALEERIEARLELGEHSALVPELVALLEEDPLRERLRGQLMLALYRCGRGPEALAAYQQLRRRLRDELGLTPSASLRGLEEAILREDASLARSSPSHSPATNLPAPLTALIGREEELRRVPQLLARGRLLTLVGPGGAGKTSLAIVAARQAASSYRHGAWLVRLSDVRDPSRIPGAVADALGLVDLDARSFDRLVSAWLESRSALLVLDNCEHLVEGCARLAERLLSAAAHVRIIATSREPLGVPGEVQMPVPPLASDDAVALFAERASAVRQDLVFAGDEDHLRRIAEQLDGLPLAIELAAARVKTLTVAEISARLEDRFGLLTSGPRTAEARHQTLRAIVDWSYELLGADERTALRQLSVFSGGWTLEAAGAVLEVEPAGALDRLTALVDRSLVVAGDGRFRMLETIRAYAEARLIEAGEYPAARERHTRYHTALAERAEGGLRGREQAVWLARLRADDANLRLALDWARERAGDQPDAALRLAGALGWYWYVGRQTDGRRQLQTTIAAATGGSAAARARALQALSLAARPAGCIVHPSGEAAEAARASLRLFPEDEPVGAALSRLLLAVEGVAGGDVPALLAEVERGRAVLELHDDAWGVGLADFIEMEIRLHAGPVDDALVFGERASSAFDALEDDWGRSAVRLHLGHGLRLAGRVDEAVGVLGLAVELSRRADLPNNLARAYVELGEAALHVGSPDEAEGWFARAELSAREVASETLLALVLLGRGEAARWRAETDQARAHYQGALAICLAGETTRVEARARTGIAAADIDDGEGERAAAELERALRLGRQIGDPSIAAVALEQLARLAAGQGDDAGRARLLDDAERIRAERRRPRSALEQRDVQAALGLVAQG